MTRYVRCLVWLCMMAPAAMASEWQLVGQAQLKVLFWRVYDSSLYTTDGQYRAGQRPVRLEIRYLRDIKAHMLVESTAQEWDKQGVQHPNRKQWLSTLESLWPDIHQNDRLVMRIDERGSSIFYWNDHELGQIDDVAFGNYFLGIWLSPNTSQPQLRLALLGGK